MVEAILTPMQLEIQQDQAQQRDWNEPSISGWLVLAVLGLFVLTVVVTTLQDWWAGRR